MQIGIIELTSHQPYLYSLCKILYSESNTIYVYCGEDIYKEMRDSYLKNDYKKINWIVKGNNENMVLFFWKIKKHIIKNNVNVLFLNTVQKYIYYFLILLRGNHFYSIVTIHNINNWFKPNPQIFFSRSKYEIIARKAILKKVDGINVFGGNLKKYIEENFDYKKLIITIPFFVYEGWDVNKKPKNQITFVVPGRINVGNSVRRDYHFLLDVFENMFGKFSGITLILLGSGSGEYANSIYQRCEKLKKNGYDIKYFDNYIPQEVYDSIMLGSDIIIAPTIKEQKLLNATEYYGLSKETGVTFAMARYCKPGIIPSNVKPAEELYSSTILYKNHNDLCSIVTRIVTDSDYYNKLLSAALTNASNFSIQRVRSNLFELFSAIDDRNNGPSV